MLKNPILKLISADSVFDLEILYNESIDKIITDISETAGEPVCVAQAHITHEANKAVIVLLIVSDTRQEQMANEEMYLNIAKTMGPELQAALANLKGGNATCEHDFEATPTGLKCTKCGGTL